MSSRLPDPAGTFAMGCYDSKDSANLVGYDLPHVTVRWRPNVWLQWGGSLGLHGPRLYNYMYADGHVVQENLMEWGTGNSGPWTPRAGD